MSLTISSGGSGGVFGPNVYIGGMVGAWVAHVVDRLIPGAGFVPAAFAVVGMAAVFAGTARVPIATLVMVAEMTGGYGLIVPSMLATAIAFAVQRSVGAKFKYSRLYESQVELRSDSPTHHEGLIKAAFTVLEQSPMINLSGVTFPHLATLLQYGTPIPIHGGQGQLRAVKIERESSLAGRTVAEVFDEFPDLVAVAVVRDEQVQFPRGGTRLEADDQLLIASARGERVEEFRRKAEGGARRRPV
jgi:CIC family chloride channel protein